MIRSFTGVRRVEVISDDAFPEMIGRKGSVARIKRSGEEAWINFDDALPEGVAAFPEDDPRGRHRCYYNDELKPSE